METKMLSFSLKNEKSELDTLCQKVEKFGKSLRLSKKCIDDRKVYRDHQWQKKMHSRSTLIWIKKTDR
jgi:hypothetical protein